MAEMLNMQSVDRDPGRHVSSLHTAASLRAGPLAALAAGLEWEPHGEPEAW
jgi:hypothetical protein